MTKHPERKKKILVAGLEFDDDFFNQFKLSTKINEIWDGSTQNYEVVFMV